MIGERIAGARGHLGLSQAKLALAAGVSRVSIVNIERGRQRAPMHLLWSIASALQREVTEFIPHRDELQARLAQPHLSPAIMAQIARAAKDDPTTLRYLTDFVQRETRQPKDSDGPT
ncbi:MAG TPA: helix-turn-helix transcriptional regulator [Gemmatimonas sp.]|nr:helix-turn-helix transcriptional regulator [Gemmatimonas sp.]